MKSLIALHDLGREGRAPFGDVWVAHDDGKVAGVAVWLPPGGYPRARRRDLMTYVRTLPTFVHCGQRMRRAVGLLGRGRQGAPRDGGAALLPRHPGHAIPSSNARVPDPRCSRRCSSAATPKGSPPTSRRRRKRTSRTTRATVRARAEDRVTPAARRSGPCSATKTRTGVVGDRRGREVTPVRLFGASLPRSVSHDLRSAALQVGMSGAAQRHSRRRRVDFFTGRVVCDLELVGVFLHAVVFDRDTQRGVSGIRCGR